MKFMREFTHRWHSIKTCVRCHARLDSDEDKCKPRKLGICYACGYMPDEHECESNTVTARLVRISPWYRFWNVTYKFEGKNEFSQFWVDNPKNRKYITI